MARHRLALSAALSDSERTRALIDGRVIPEGVSLTPTVLHGSEMFWRQLRYADFDLSEMSLSSLLIATSHGDDRWAAIPVFTMRKFFHTGILVRRNAEINSPADLKGKRVGVPEYQQTSAIWSRGILEREFGVKSRDIEWFMERGPERSHGHATGFTPPPGIVLHQIPPETNIGEMLVRGELDATLLYLTDPNLVDRSRIDLSKVSEIIPLFPDPKAEGQRFYAATGLFPVNHTVVVRRSLLDQHPWLALNLYSGFLAAKQEVERYAFSMLQPYFDSGLLASNVERKIRTNDPLAYGFRAALPVLRRLAEHVYEQGLTDRLVKIEDIFAPTTLDI